MAEANSYDGDKRNKVEENTVSQMERWELLDTDALHGLRLATLHVLFSNYVGFGSLWWCICFTFSRAIRINSYNTVWESKIHSLLCGRILPETLGEINAIVLYFSHIFNCPWTGK